MFNRGQKVKVKLQSGDTAYGEVLETFDPMQGYWWVRYKNDMEDEEVVLFESHDIEILNIQTPCECGSRKLGSDRHSHWCPSYV